MQINSSRGPSRSRKFCLADVSPLIDLLSQDNTKPGGRKRHSNSPINYSCRDFLFFSLSFFLRFDLREEGEERNENRWSEGESDRERDSPHSSLCIIERAAASYRCTRSRNGAASKGVRLRIFRLEESPLRDNSPANHFASADERRRTCQRRHDFNRRTSAFGASPVQAVMYFSGRERARLQYLTLLTMLFLLMNDPAKYLVIISHVSAILFASPPPYANVVTIRHSHTASTYNHLYRILRPDHVNNPYQ